MPKTKITDFDIVFALHTGVTIMMEKNAAFDDASDNEVPFVLSLPEKGEIILTPPNGGELAIQGVSLKMMTEIAERGFFMIYELEDGEMARCVPCARAI